MRGQDAQAAVVVAVVEEAEERVVGSPHERNLVLTAIPICFCPV